MRDFVLTYALTHHVVCGATAMLMLVEGCGQTNLGKNWGDGLAVDPKVVSDYRIDSANNFFKQVIYKPYANNVVVAPHVYPPSISKSTGENTVRHPHLQSPICCALLISGGRQNSALAHANNFLPATSSLQCLT